MSMKFQCDNDSHVRRHHTLEPIYSTLDIHGPLFWWMGLYYSQRLVRWNRPIIGNETCQKEIRTSEQAVTGRSSFHRLTICRLVGWDDLGVFNFWTNSINRHDRMIDASSDSVQSAENGLNPTPSKNILFFSLLFYYTFIVSTFHML